MTVYLPITVDMCNPYPLKAMNIPQYNTGRGVLITLTAAGAVVVPDKESLYIYVKKSDGTVAYANCSLQGTQIKADFDEQMTAVVGVMDVEIQMVDSSGNSITTTIFKINVMASNIDYQKITSQDEFLALVSALTEVNELKKNGLKGDPGKAATLQIGTVVASDPGSDPEVTNSGTEQNAVLNFVLPRGIPGPQGPAIDTVNPTEATESDSGKAADAYQTKLALDEQNVKMIKIMKKTYEISCTTSYASTIGYKGSKNISSDFPSSLIAVIPLGCTQTTDSGRVGNIIYREDGNLYLNMPISCTAHAEVLFLYT